jgi:hypothetical protein
MFCYLMTAFTALLFVVLTPGVLLTLPSKTSDKIVVALVHGLVFVLLYHLTYNVVLNWTHKYEGFYDCLEYDEDGNCIVEGFVDCLEYDEDGNCIVEGFVDCLEYDEDGNCIVEGFKTQKSKLKPVASGCVGATKATLVAANKAVGACAPPAGKKAVAIAPFAKKVNAAAKRANAVAKKAKAVTKKAIAKPMTQAEKDLVSANKIINKQAAELKMLRSLVTPRL